MRIDICAKLRKQHNMLCNHNVYDIINKVNILIFPSCISTPTMIIIYENDLLSHSYMSSRSTEDFIRENFCGYQDNS